MSRPGDDAYADSGERSCVPRWLWLAALIGVLVVAVIVVVMLTLGGHDPPSHAPGAG